MTSLRRRVRGIVRQPDVKAGAGALCFLAVLLLAWWLAARWYEARLVEQQRAEAAAETTLRANALSSAINRRLARLQGLSAFAQVELAAGDLSPWFGEFASELYRGTLGVRYLAVAPANTVRYLYPEAGNEEMIGYDLTLDVRAEVRSGALRAIGSDEIVVSTPLNTPQGSRDLIAHQAVSHNGKHWGLVSIALDFPAILSEAGLSEARDDLSFALRDSAGRTFLGSPDLTGQDPVVAVVRLPGESWELAGAPPGGWRSTAGAPLRISQIGGLVIVCLGTGLVYLSINRQARLARAVGQRTREIAAINTQLERDIAERRRAEAALVESEEQYRRVFESVRDGLLILDMDGQLAGYNPAAAQMFGYTPEEFSQAHAGSPVHAGRLSRLEEFLTIVERGEVFRGRATGLSRDGERFHMQVLGTAFAYRGSPHALAVLHDITEEVQAYRLMEERVESRTRELSTLLEVSTHISSTLELEPLLGLILQQLSTVVACDGASILILEGEELRTMAHRGPIPRESLARMHLSRERAGDLWEAMQGHEPLIIGDIRGDGWLAQAFRLAVGDELLAQELSYVRTWVGVPLVVQEQLIGWLGLHHSRPDAYGRHDANLAQTVANQAAVAIQNARLYGQARRLAALDERQRLARELHDSVSQALYGIGLGARTAQALLNRAPAERELRAALAEPLDYVLSLADAGLAEMRALIFELRPDALEKEGLVAALKRRAMALQSRHGLQVIADLGHEPELPFETEEALYRIAQEALHNVVKHARASRVEIRLAPADDEITLVILDDGRGFDPEQPFEGRMGLESMRQRAQSAGGQTAIESTPGRGARVLVRLPWAGATGNP